MRRLFKGTNFEDVQEMNRTLIIRLLRKMQICSRADLSKATGLKQATITNIINDFLDWGLVKETGIITGEKGRRSIGIALNSEEYFVIGVRLTRKFFLVGLFDISGKDCEIVKTDIDVFAGSDYAMDKIKQEIIRIIKENKGKAILGIGVALPGPFYQREGRIALMTEFPGWEHISIKDELEKTFEMPVILDHDANAGALAEWWIGPNTIDSGSMVYMAVGQGIGAGIVINGNVYRGVLGIAGEVGHMSISYDGPKCECGNNGCLQLYCSTIAFAKRVQKEMANYPQTMLREDFSFKQLVDAVIAKDELAYIEFKKIAWYLGIGIVNIINTYNPDVIIIGDELSMIGDDLINSIKETVREHTLKDIAEKTEIKLTSFKHDSAFIGAAALAIRNALNNSALFLNATQSSTTH